MPAFAANAAAMIVRPLGRAPFAIAGLVLLGVKLTLDRVLTETVFGRTWSPSVYLAPFGGATSIGRLSAGEAHYAAALVALALPFVTAGTWLTLRRLCAVGWPPWLVVLFFLPIVNLAFFVTLCAVPTPARRRPCPRTFPPGGARGCRSRGSAPRSRRASSSQRSDSAS